MVSYNFRAMLSDENEKKENILTSDTLDSDTTSQESEQNQGPYNSSHMTQCAMGKSNE